MAKGNREETIADVLEIIANIDNIQEMRNQVLKLQGKLRKFYPIISLAKIPIEIGEIKNE